MPKCCRHRVRAQSRFNGKRAMKTAHAVRRDSRHTRRLCRSSPPISSANCDRGSL